MLRLLLVCAFAPAALAQPTELFFSEYIEGTSNNKALEIYNGTGASVSLASGGYSVQMFFNGSSSAGLTINLTGTVAAGDVYVLAHSSADPAILAQADQTNGAGWFNGDDAVVLRKGPTAIDVIGQIGFDPGSEWGSGLTSTADNTLRRKPTFCGDTNGSDAFDPAAEWDGFPTNTFGGLGSHSFSSCAGAPPPPPPVPVVEIFEIQGSGMASPYTGQRVETQDNIVTAVDTNGFFIQTPDFRADSDPATSNGIFVFTGSAPAVAVGHQVDVTGTVAEFFNFTEIGSPTVVFNAAGNPLPAMVRFDSNTPSPNRPQPANELERFEGMLVRVERGVTTAPSDEFGDVKIVARPSRAFREPGILFPGLPGLPVWDGNPEIFEMDPDALGLPNLNLPAGSAIDLAEGVLAFAFGDYQIWPKVLNVSPAPLPVPVRERASGEMIIASQNLLRLLDTVNDPDKADEPVPTPESYAARLRKFSLHIREVLGSPDILAVQEAENLGVLQDLAARIFFDDAMVRYTPYLVEGNDVSGIDVGFLARDTVRVQSVTQFGKDDTFEFEGTTFLLNDRPPLVLRGIALGSFRITVIAVHQRSLSGIEGADGPRIRAKRFEQSKRLAQLIQALQSLRATNRLVVLGDFNAFQFTDGYVDAMGIVTGNLDPAGALLTPEQDLVEPDLTNQVLMMPEDQRYSFIFAGSAQSLDHALTTAALQPFVRGAQYSRGNADAPSSYGASQDSPLRSSDHDSIALFIMTNPAIVAGQSTGN